MKILAIDSSGQVASVALVQDGVLRGEFTVNNGLTHSQTLLPMLDILKQQLDLGLASVEAVAVAGGPGSFTGLRIGASTAKGLALALDVPLVPVSTVEALAYNCFGAAGVVCPLMDARRDQVYTGIYRFEGEEMTALREPCAVSIEEIADMLNAAGERVTLLGDGADVHRERIPELLRVPFVFAPAHLSLQRAGAVGALAEQYLRAGRAVPGAAFAPEYLRLSQAERERAAREQAEKAAAGEAP